MQSIKVVTVGDEAVGKTSLLSSFTNNTFSEEYKPTVFDVYSITAVVYGKDINLTFWDTSGQEEYNRFRPLSYVQADVFIICFSLVDHASFDNVLTKWYTEVRFYCSKTPIILVGTTLDLREANETIDTVPKTKSTAVTYEQGFSRSVDIGAFKYIECSSVTQQGLRFLFDKVIEAALKAQETKQQNICKII